MSSSEYDEPIEDDDERHALTEKLIVDGSSGVTRGVTPARSVTRQAL